jgi:hypothetical protein
MSPWPKGKPNPGGGWANPAHPAHRPAGGGEPVPFENGNTAAVVHGARSRSNRLIMPEAEALEAQVLETVPYLQDASYAPAVRRWAIAEAWCDRLGAWLEENGAIAAEGTVRPVLDSLRLWQQRASQEADRLGLTPAARVKFERDVSTTRVNLARLMEEQDSDGE